LQYGAPDCPAPECAEVLPGFPFLFDGGLWGGPCCPPAPGTLRPTPRPGAPTGQPTPEELRQADEALRLAADLIAAGDPEGYLLQARAYALRRDWRRGLQSYARAMKDALRPEYAQYAQDLQLLLRQSPPGSDMGQQPKVVNRGPAGRNPSARAPVTRAGGTLPTRLPDASPAAAGEGVPARAAGGPAAPQATPAKDGGPRGPDPLLLPDWRELEKAARPEPLPTPAGTPDLKRADRAYHLGREHYTRGDFAGAERAFREAVRWHAEDARHWYFLGLALLQQGRTDLAHGSFREGGRREQQNRPHSADINLSLERVQGPARQALNAHRSR
jgi:tetratricopeptide (TPR) repeat protein